MIVKKAQALAALVLLVVAGTAAPVASAAVVDTSAWYVLVNRHSGKALDVHELATHDGARIAQHSRNDGAWQQWRFVDSGGGFYRLRSRHSGKVLDVPGASTANGVDLTQWTDHNGPNQQFRLADSPDGHVRLINRNSGKAVDVLDFSTADAARVVQWTDLNGANQQWRLVRIGADYPNPQPVSGDIGVHDPAIVKRPGGGYLLAHTGNGVSLKTSADRVTFRNAGAAFPGGTPWASTYTNGSSHLWAPDISHHNGRYLLYYSASTFGSNRSAIFLATSTTGAAGSWTHQGLVIESRSSDDFNAIDPNLVVDAEGRWWLSFGSFWSGIKLVRLDPATGRRLDGAMVGTANSGSIEAPFIVKRGAYYYQYVSFGYCCRGAASTYRIVVGRSTSVTGPYHDRAGVAMANGGGTEILAGHGTVHGPGHQAVLADTDGDFLVYHYYTDSGASLLGINRLAYDAAGWPTVN
ncbi:hypothetical protein GCM10023148_06430 [Actinokineospora soli]